MPDFPDLPAVDDLTGEADERHEQRFSRVVAIAIVLATLAAAATAYLQAAARRTADDASARSTQLAAAGLAARHFEDAAAYMLVERYKLAAQQRTRAAQAEAEMVFGPASGRPAAGGERRRWEVVATQTERETASIAHAYGLEPITPDGRLGPRADTYFPQLFVAESRYDTYLLGAERDAADVEGAEASGQVSRSAIVLTIIAVSVFLFGYSLTPYAGRTQSLFAGAGAALLLGGGIWGAIIALQAPHRPPVAAARAFADGSAAYYGDEYGPAIRDFSRTIALFPQLAQAYALRARAEFDAGSPQRSGPLSLTSAPALAAAAADDERAIAGRDDDSTVAFNAGYELVSLGLRRGDPALLRRGLADSLTARDARPADPLTEFNVAVALLALGRVADAGAAYHVAVERTIYTDVAHHTARNDVNAEEADLAGALTDLAAVAAHSGPSRRRVIETIAAGLVAPITRDSYQEAPFGGSTPAAASASLRLDVSPASASFTLVAPRHLDVLNDDVSAQWYVNTPGGLGWYDLSSISGAISPPSGDIGVNGATVSVGRAEVRVTAPYLPVTSACLSPGEYRVDVYDGKRLAARATRTFTFPPLVAARLLDLGVAFCRPAAWVPASKLVPGLLDGYRSRDGRAGEVVLSFTPGAFGTSATAPSATVLAKALAHLAPALPARLVGGRDTSAVPFGFDHALVRAYRYRSGSALAGVGRAPSGQIVVAVTFGTDGFMARAGRTILSTLSPTS